MLLLLAQIGLFIGGVYTLIKGEVPKFLFSGTTGQYTLPKPRARLLAIPMLLQVPLAVVLLLILYLAIGEDADAISGLVELFSVALVGASVMIGIRVLRVPDAGFINASPAEQQEVTTRQAIEKRINGSMIYVVLSFLGPVGLITGPINIIRLSRTMRLIRERGIGQEFYGRAQAALMLSIAMTGIWAIAAALLLGLMVTLAL